MSRIDDGHMEGIAEKIALPIQTKRRYIMNNKTIATRPITIPSIFSDFFEPWNDWISDSRLSRALTVPKANLTEDKDSYMLSVAAPGLHKKDFNIDVTGDLLTVSAEQEHEKEEKEEKYHRQEYNYSSFSRTFTLPAEVVKEKIEASYDGGVLKISIPKRTQATPKPESKIQVK